MRGIRKSLARVAPAGIILASVVFLLGSPASSLADPCTDPPPAGLNGTIVGLECQVSGPVTVQGTYAIAQILHLCGPGGTCANPTAAVLTVPPAAGGNNLTLNISGGLIMDIGSSIAGDVFTASGVGANITIHVNSDVLLHGNGTDGAKITSNNVAGSCSGGRSGNITVTSGGNITAEPGSVVSTGDLSTSKGNGLGPHCPGGEILIEAGEGSVDIDGKVLSQSSMTGVGAKQPPGGGLITITAGCDLTVSDAGVVSSRGLDPGADLVRLSGGCSVLVDGLVESTGPGHAVPNSPPNHCATGVYAGIKPPNSTACIQIVSGGILIIDSSPPHNGEVNADTAQSGGHQIAWIDIFARFNLAVQGDTVAPYAVHANEFVTNADGGLITLKAKGQLSIQGLAVQANATNGGGRGGNVDMESDDALGFGPGSSVQARGATSGGGHQGGGIIFGESWKSSLAGTATADLNASGGPPAGSITLKGCTGVFYNGTSTPTFVPGGGCGSVGFPGYIIFPGCACALPCPR